MSDSDIVTRCPQCNTAFRVTPNQLAVADGVVRCGSCLAVFKAVDYEARTTVTTPQTPKSSMAQSSTNTNEPKEKIDASDELIKDNDEESALDLNEDIYDLDVDNIHKKKTSLFDRKIKPSTEQKRESADESWALDMLAELEDDKVELPQITRSPKKISIEPKQEELLQEEPHRKESPSEKSVEENHVSESLEPDEFDFDFEFELKPQAEEDLEFNPELEAEEELEPELDFELEPDAGPGLDLEPEYETEIELESELELDPELEDSYVTDDLTDTSPIDIRDTDNTSAKKLEDADALFFDEDQAEFVSPKPKSLKEKFLQKAFGHQEEEIEESSITQISDEEIENAMHSRTTYVDDAKGYLANIEPAPVEMEWYESENTQRWLWLGGALLLGIVLIIQVAVFRFDTLSKHPTYRPLYNTACKVVGCRLPNLIDTGKIRTTNLVVRSHPGRQNALVVDAIMINNAKFKQPYPALKLEFSNINDAIVASRNLQPSDYLLGELAGATQMPPNQPIQISLAIVDPGATAVNYQLTVIKAARK